MRVCKCVCVQISVPVQKRSKVMQIMASHYLENFLASDATALNPSQT